MFGKKSENILILKTDTLSAFVAAEPVFDAIRDHHKDARLSLLTTQSLQRVARAAPYFDQVAALPDFKNPEARKALLKQLKAARFARVYDLSGDDVARRIQGALKGGLGIGGPKWHSAAPMAKNKKKQEAAPAPNLEKLQTSAGLSASGRKPDFLWALEARKDSANMKPAWFGVSTPFALLMPGLDEARRWPAQSYGDLARYLGRNGVMPVMVGQKELHNFGDAVSEIAPEVVDLTGKTDHLQLAALSREAACFISDAAEEVELAVAVGCAGVLVKRASEAQAIPSGRHVMALTATTDLTEISSDFVWRALGNMGLLPSEGVSREPVAL